MKIEFISITNFRSLKDTQTIDNFWDSLILVWKNNSWKSSIINALKLFFEWWKNFWLNENDFYKWKNQIEIIVWFKNVFDNYLVNFFKFNFWVQETRKIKNIDWFWDYEFSTIETDQWLSQNQIELLKNYYLETQKKKYVIEKNKLEIKMIANIWDLKTNYFVWNKLIKDVDIFPNFLFIDDERNFSNEQSWKSWTFSEKLFKSIEIDTSNTKTYEKIIWEIKNWDDISNLSIADLQVILERKIKTQSKNIWETISKYFQQFYKNFNYEIRFNPTTSISHKSFSLDTKIYNPFLDIETDLNNVWAWVRSIYILALLKAYNEINNWKNTILCIEEPEIYLHPELQKQMAQILKMLSKEHTIIFSTHSTLMFKDFNINCVKKISIENYETKIYQWEYEEIIDELWYSTIDILNWKFILLVEWVQDKQRFLYLLKKFYKINDNDFKEIIIISTDWCSNIWYYATLKFLDKLYLKENFCIIRDSDWKDKNSIKTNLIKEIESKIKINNLWFKILILEYYSFENYFLNFSILNKLWFSLDKNKFLINFFKKHWDYIQQNLKEDNWTQTKLNLDNIKTDLEKTKTYIKWHLIYNFLIDNFKNIWEKTSFDIKFIENSTYNDFKQIINFFDNQQFFENFEKINR